MAELLGGHRSLVLISFRDPLPYLTDNPYSDGSGVPENIENADAGIDGSNGTWNDGELSSYYSCRASEPYGSTSVLWRFAS